MTKKQAVQLAIKAINLQIRQLAQQANLEDIYHADLPGTITASQQRKRLLEARNILEAET